MDIILKDCKILIVDDENDCINLIKSMLKNLYSNIISTQRGRECISIAETEKPDLILLDIMMPNASGFDICSKLKLNEKTRNIPVIFLTALDKSENIVNGFKSGAVDYLIKPFEKEELIVRIKTHLESYLIKNKLEQIISDKIAEIKNANDVITRKNIVLEEILSKIENDKITVIKDFIENIDANVLSILKKVSLTENNMNLNLAISNLEKIMLSTKEKNDLLYSDLTERELEICEFIKKGFSSKKIAETLTLSLQTIERHRFNIRNKLLLSHDNNLQNYLENL